MHREGRTGRWFGCGNLGSAFPACKLSKLAGHASCFLSPPGATPGGHSLHGRPEPAHRCSPCDLERTTFPAEPIDFLTNTFHYHHILTMMSQNVTTVVLPIACYDFQKRLSKATPCSHHPSHIDARHQMMPS
jgi:hypothetical protein